MAEIKLLPRQEFEIVLNDGTVIPGKFGTWALRRLTDKHKLTLSEGLPTLQTLGGLMDYIVFAVEYMTRKNKKDTFYTDMDVSDWVDQLGGVQSGAFLSLVKHTQDEGPTEEKKTELKTQPS